MKTHAHAYGFGATLDVAFDGAVERVRAELAKQGFGVLTEIDVAATLKSKLGVDFRRYVILGACNPVLAHQALSAEREIGLLLPCNVIVYEDETPNRSVVSIMDPQAALALAGNDAVAGLAADVRDRLQQVINGLENAV
jgi:uncharacterized protein (DUF302 family)